MNKARTLASEIGVGGEKVEEIILTAIKDAYRENKRRFDPTLHDRPMNFGLNNYTTISGFITERFAEQLPMARVTNFDNVLQVEINGKKIRFAKLGNTETDDLDPKKFFTGPHREEIAQESDLKLVFGQNADGEWRYGPQDEENVYILIGHFGTVKGGLRKVTAGAVRGTAGGDLPWVWSEDIFIVGVEAELPDPMPFVSAPSPSIPTIGDGAPRLRLVMRKDDSEEGESS